MATTSKPRTMFEKIWDAHVVHAEPGKQTILYIDLHLVHEVTSPQAFEGLRLAGRKVRRPELTVATPDHNVPTTDRAAADRRPDLRSSRSTRCGTTAGSLAFGCTTSTTRSRESSTSSGRSWGSRSRA